jgi:pteridine reductase
MSLEGKTILVTGASRRLGRTIAIAAAKAGADIVLHYGHSESEAAKTAETIKNLGRNVWALQADLTDTKQAHSLCEKAFSLSTIFALVNNAAIFKPISFTETSIDDWNLHFTTNLTAPFLLSQYFANHISPSTPGRIINILDWRALRPGKDHFPYTISKAALAALTISMALSLAPHITVNGIALGALLPPENEPENPNLIKSIPMKRWANLDELGSLVLFLLDGPSFITGEIIHLDGGRHLL